MDYQKYKFSENTDKEYVKHMREAVSRKSKCMKMKEAGQEKNY